MSKSERTRKRILENAAGTAGSGQLCFLDEMGLNGALDDLQRACHGLRVRAQSSRSGQGKLKIHSLLAAADHHAVSA